MGFHRLNTLRVLMHGWTFPYRSQRMAVFAENAVATSQPLAAQAGLRMLLDGGNAVDAALATAITLTVVEPTSNGIGSDAFALIWDGSELHGINGSGRSPSAWSPERFSDYDVMPQFGWDAVTVPGAVSVWAELSRRFGVLEFAKLFEPAIYYANNGYGVSPITAQKWREAAPSFVDFPDFCATFLPGGKPPRAGDLFKSKEMAETLKEIGASYGESFYRGRLAEKIADCAQSQGGLLSFDDLAEHKVLWVEPISCTYRGNKVHQIPPNSQGLGVLQCLGILNEFDLSGYPVDSADSVHLQVEAMKLSFSDIFRHLADPEAMSIDQQNLIDSHYLAKRASLIDMDSARFPQSGFATEPGTVYLSTADSSGMMVSFIQSNYHGFGSGIVVPETGISMHNRGCGFTLEKGHPNQVGGSKRPFHTIIPGFVTRDEKPVLSFGVMGAHMQGQGQVQMLTRLFDYHQNPQTASDAPRWHVAPTGELSLENGVSSAVVNELKDRGHTVLVDDPQSLFGGAQLIQRIVGGYICGSDHRKDGLAVGF